MTFSHETRSESVELLRKAFVASVLLIAVLVQNGMQTCENRLHTQRIFPQFVAIYFLIYIWT